jgi:RNA polymerase sigma-70 factor (ECF subfamily)
MEMEPGPPSEREFEDLLRRHAPGLRSLLRRSARSPDLRGDALQETLARAWAARAGYDAARPFGPWLATIALRVARDLARARGRRPDRESLDAASDGATEERDATGAGGDPARALELKSEVERLMRALDDVAEPARAIFLRFHRDGASLQQIAAETELPLNTVKSHLHRARLRLAARLRERGGDDASGNGSP